MYLDSVHFLVGEGEGDVVGVAGVDTAEPGGHAGQAGVEAVVDEVAQPGAGRAHLGEGRFHRSRAAAVAGLPDGSSRCGGSRPSRAWRGWKGRSRRGRSGGRRPGPGGPGVGDDRLAAFEAGGGRMGLDVCEQPAEDEALETFEVGLGGLDPPGPPERLGTVNWR